MNKQKTIKALEELAKSEYSTATALDAALTTAEDSNLRRNYRKWRDAHIKHAEALNGRIKDLGGHTTPYEFHDGSVYPIVWNLIRGTRDYKSLAGVRLVARRSVKQYVDHLDQIEDAKTLHIVHKNLEANENEVQWYDDQVIAQHDLEIDAELKKTREYARSLDKEVKEPPEHRRGTPLAALAVAGALGVAAYFITRRGKEQDEDGFADMYDYPDGASPTEKVDEAKALVVSGS